MGVDLEALDCIVDHSTGTRLQHDIMRRKFRKHVRQFGFQHLYDHLDYDWRFRLAAARIFLGDFSNWTGWIYRTQWSANRFWTETRIPRWDGRPVSRLYVVGEQGVGDEILWASVLPECMIRCKEVIYACDKRLIPILQRSLRGLRCVERVEDRDPEGPFDAYIPGADLLPMFRTKASHFPRRKYLVADADRVAEFEAFRGRTGLGWAGRQGRIDPLKFHVEQPLSLQYSESHPDIEVPPVDLKDDLEGVLALCTVLDRVVCVPSTIYHIAGAAGVKVDVVRADEAGEVENQIDWSSPPGQSPWYPNVYVHGNIQRQPNKISPGKDFVSRVA